LTQGTAPLAETEFERDVMTMIAEIVDWEVELDRPLGAATRLIGDLGFQSLDIVMLIIAIEGRYARQDLPFDELLTVDGDYVPDLTVAEVAAFLALHVEGAAR
jgi:acyl carrier protein